MDLAQKANRVKRDLQAALHKPEPTSLKHALDAFDAFADAVVEEIGKLKAAQGPGADAPFADRPIAGPGEDLDVGETARDQEEHAPVTG